MARITRKSVIEKIAIEMAAYDSLVENNRDLLGHDYGVLISDTIKRKYPDVETYLEHHYKGWKVDSLQTQISYYNARVRELQETVEFYKYLESEEGKAWYAAEDKLRTDNWNEYRGLAESTAESLNEVINNWGIQSARFDGIGCYESSIHGKYEIRFEVVFSKDGFHRFDGCYNDDEGFRVNIPNVGEFRITNEYDDSNSAMYGFAGMLINSPAFREELEDIMDKFIQDSAQFVKNAYAICTSRLSKATTYYIKKNREKDAK